jgi:tetratricopeptide (TPR) repeat protein
MTTSRVTRALISAALALTIAGCAASQDPATVADLSLRAGITAFGAGQGAQAEKDFRAALIADPENVYAYYDLGVVAGTYDTVQAEYYYRIALGHDPTYTPALMNLSKLLADQGRTDEAIELLRQVAMFAPNLASGQYRLGLLLAAAGRDAESASALAAAKSIDFTMDDTRAEVVFGPTAEGSAVMASRGK